MSVLIEGVHLPENCHDCDALGYSDIVYLKCPAIKDSTKFNFWDRPEGCPLVEVTEVKIEKDAFISIENGGVVYFQERRE